MAPELDVRVRCSKGRSGLFPELRDYYQELGRHSQLRTSAHAGKQIERPYFKRNGLASSYLSEPRPERRNRSLKVTTILSCNAAAG